MIIIAGTSAPGGISQVIKGYARDGVFEKWDVRWIKTHVAGGILHRVLAALYGLCSVIFWMACGRVQLVHTHAAMRGSFWRKSILVFAARILGVPVVVHLHGSEMKVFYSSSNRFARWCVRSALERADRVVVLSAGWAEYVKVIAPAAKVSVIANYSPAIPLAHNAHGMEKKNNKFVFLFLGALIDRKGIYELLPAFAKLSSEFPDTELWLGGSGEMEKVQAVVDQNPLAAVRLLGWVDDITKNQLLMAVDAFVLPSKNENLPLSIIEAMSAALPIISTRIGGIPEMLTDGEEALLIAPGQVDPLYEALRKIRTDPAGADLISRNALKRYAAEFSPEIGLPKIDALYAQFSKKNISHRSKV